MRRLYGAGPGQLVALLGCFAVSAYAVTRLLGDLPVLVRIGIWFLGAALAWDLVLGPALALADRVLRRLLPGAALNAVRVPALISGVLLLVWAPLILSRSAETYERKSGLSADPYLERWLAVTAVLFAVSGLVVGARQLRRRRSPTGTA